VSAPFEPSAAEANTRAEAGGFPRRILLVDGSEENRALTLALLRRRGSEIEIADHAAAALGLLEREQFDLILVDMQLSVMDGYTTIHERTPE